LALAAGQAAPRLHLSPARTGACVLARGSHSKLRRGGQAWLIQPQELTAFEHRSRTHTADEPAPVRVEASGGRGGEPVGLRARSEGLRSAPRAVLPRASPAGAKRAAARVRAAAAGAHLGGAGAVDLGRTAAVPELASARAGGDGAEAGGTSSRSNRGAGV